MLVSEFAHSLGQPNNKALKENIKLLIIHTRNEIIRRSYENHSYMRIYQEHFHQGLTILPPVCRSLVCFVRLNQGFQE